MACASVRQWQDSRSREVIFRTRPASPRGNRVRDSTRDDAGD